MSASLGSARRATLVAASAGLALATLAVPASASARLASASAPSSTTSSASTHRPTASRPPAARSYRHRNRYVQVNLVSDQPGAAAVTDPNLVNAWGLSQGPTSPVWVSDNGTDVSTLYTGGGAGQTPSAVPLVVQIPGGAPTGQIFNPTTGFTLSNGQPALFVFAGEDGAITAWNPQLSPATSAEQVATVPGSVLKGIALVTGYAGPRLLIADFGQGKVVELNSSFEQVRLPHWAFRDPYLPKSYSPFNVAVLGSRVFVTYAVHRGGADDVAGPGHGIVDVYSTGGQLLQRFASHGVLNSPWGLAVAPSRFGKFSDDVLIGNFGDGRIHAFDPASGEFKGTLRDAYGTPIAIDGLWGLLPGNGTSAGVDDLWFSAGPQGESHGLLGVLRAAH